MPRRMPQAAGLAMGLLLCGSSSDKAQEMLVRGTRKRSKRGLGPVGLRWL
jgi:hypothetical protein